MTIRRPNLRPPLAAMLVAMVLMCAFAAAPSLAAKVFLPGSGSWHEPGNWSPSGVPGPDDDVFVGVGQTVHISGPATARNVTVDSGGNVRVASPGVLSLHGPTQTVHGAIHLNINGGPLSPGTELHFAASSEISGFGSVIMNRSGPGSRVVVAPDMVLVIHIEISGVGRLQGRFENRGRIIGTGLALALGGADIFNVGLIEARTGGVVSFFDRDLVQAPTGRLRTAGGGQIAFTIASVQGGLLESDGSPGAEFISSSTSPFLTRLVDVSAEFTVTIRFLSHSGAEIRSSRVDANLRVDPLVTIEIIDTELLPLSLVSIGSDAAARLSNTQCRGLVSVAPRAALTCELVRFLPEGRCEGSGAQITLRDVECLGSMAYDFCRVALAGRVVACGAGASWSITGNAGRSAVACEPGVQVEVCDAAEFFLDACDGNLAQSTWTWANGATSSMSHSSLSLSDAVLSVHSAHARVQNSSLTGEGQYWAVIDGQLVLHTITNDSGLGAAEFELLRAQFLAQQTIFLGKMFANASESEIQCFESALSTTTAEFNLNFSQASFDGSTTAPGTSFNLIDSSLGCARGTYAIDFLAADNSLLTSDESLIEVQTIHFDLTSAAAFGAGVDFRVGESFSSEAPVGSIVWDPTARMTATGGTSGTTHLTPWLPDQGPQPQFAAAVVPAVFDVSAGATCLLQSNPGYALYFDTMTLNAGSVLNKSNCVPIYVFGTTVIDSTAEVIECSTTPPDLDQIAADLDSIALSMSVFPLNLMAGPNDRANANRRDQVVEHLMNAAGAVRATELDEAVSVVTEVTRKVDPEFEPVWYLHSPENQVELELLGQVLHILLDARARHDAGGE